MKPRGAKAATVAVLAVAVFIFAFVNREALIQNVLSANPEKIADFHETGVTLAYGYDAAPSFYSNSNAGFYFCTKDGVKYINAETGETVWEDVFTMSAPELFGAGDYVIIGEAGGDAVFVYSPEGRAYEYAFSGEAMNFNVNSAGHSAIIIKTSDGYETRAINRFGLCVWQFRHKNANIYPVAAAVSNDERIVAVSMLDANAFLSSSVFFAYIDRDEAKPYGDTIFASIPKDGQIVALTRFLGGRFFCASNAETSVTEFDQEAGLKSNSTSPLDNMVDFAGFFGDKGYVLCYGDAMPDKDGSPAGTLAFFGADGEPLGEWFLGAKATYLNCSQNNAVAGVNRRYFAFDTRGKLVWQYNAVRDYKQIVCIGDGSSAIFASATEAVVMKRGK